MLWYKYMTSEISSLTNVLLGINAAVAVAGKRFKSLAPLIQETRQSKTYGSWSCVDPYLSSL